MSKVNPQLALTFISEISLDLAEDFSTTEHFANALNALTQLLNASTVVVSRIFKDKDNLELLLKNNFAKQVADNTIELSHSAAQFREIPQFFNDLLAIKKEVELSTSAFFSTINHNIICNGPSSTTTNSFYVLPFYLDDSLVGLVAYQAEASIDLDVTHPTVYNVLRTTFINEHKNYSRDIELNTYQLVLDLMPQRVFWKNRDSVYLGCNKAFSDDASLNSPNDIVGVTDHDIFPDQAELYRSDDAKTMETREHLINSEEPQTHANGEQIWLKTSKRPIVTKENILIGIIGTYDDITPLKNTQNELYKAKDELENRVIKRTKELTESNTKLESAIHELKSAQEHLVETEKMAALGSLVAGVAHEINTPLGVAVTSSSYLEKVARSLEEDVNSGNITQSKFNETCGNIVTSCGFVLSNLERASQLVRNFKMIAVDQSNDKKRQVLISEYLFNVVNAMTPKTKSKNIKIFLQGDETITISTLPGTVAQIITNLIDNAVVHAFDQRDSGDIKISYVIKNSELILSFEDNGCGIDPSYLHKVFEPFYTSKRGHGGSGLGLSIVYNLVTQQLNGNIICESKKDQWTRFVISIPAN